MRTWAKWTLGILAVSAVSGVVQRLGGEPMAAAAAGLAMRLFFAGILLWLLLRLVLFLRLLFAPVTKKMAEVGKVIDPAASKVSQHIDDSLRRAGLGAVADSNIRLDKAIKRIDSAIGSALDEAQRKVDERNKP